MIIILTGRTVHRRQFDSTPFRTEMGHEGRIYGTDHYADYKFKGPDAESLALLFAKESGGEYLTRKHTDGRPKAHVARVRY